MIRNELEDFVKMPRSIDYVLIPVTIENTYIGCVFLSFHVHEFCPTKGFGRAHLHYC